jgi:hypothetical protein
MRWALDINIIFRKRKVSGDNSNTEPPDPIPNSEVKRVSADGTAWVTVWESRTSPD